jgi:hypothetical protein
MRCRAVPIVISARQYFYGGSICPAGCHCAALPSFSGFRRTSEPPTEDHRPSSCQGIVGTFAQTGQLTHDHLVLGDLMV